MFNFGNFEPSPDKKSMGMMPLSPDNEAMDISGVDSKKKDVSNLSLAMQDSEELVMA